MTVDATMDFSESVTDLTDPVTDASESATQEIRIAAVLNGGVSLAVWMSGVTLELHHLGLASRGLNGVNKGRWSTYRQVLGLLQATARVDVIAGTSAGGLNGAFLALSIARCRDFGLLRDVWVDEGALEKLLRPALEKNPPSPLRGDQFFLPRIQEALTGILSTDNAELADPSDEGRPPVELILTGTLWNGRESTFSDDMGVSITERDYDATFRFANRVPPELRDSAGDLDGQNDVGLVQNLAAAARCTSSFPAAFEPHYVTTAPEAVAVPGRWSSSAGQANFSRSQYVLDGGVLLNKPIRPALDAIYRQSADKQVRRVLAYVVPDPGGQPIPDDPSTHPSPPQPPIPAAGDVLLSLLTRLQSTDSVSRELTEIRDNNIAVTDRRRARSRLAAALTEATESLSEVLYPAYREARRDSACRTMGKLIAAGQRISGERWSRKEIVDALQRVAQTVGFGFVPPEVLAGALAGSGTEWRWGQTTLVHIGDTATDVLRRALELAPLESDARVRIIAARRELVAQMAHIADYNASLNNFWRAAPRRPAPTKGEPEHVGPIPDRSATTSGSASAADLAHLDAWLTGLLPEWDNTPPSGSAPGAPPGGRRAGQHQAALEIARILSGAAQWISDVLAAPNEAMADDACVEELRRLYTWLLAPAPDADVPEGPDPAGVLERTLRLEIVQFACGMAFTGNEQLVELVQVSCADPHRIAGMQLHHFGAFYRAPWRVNDWAEGRHDGARQVMRFLLSPDRLRQCGYTVEGKDDLLKKFEDIAVPAGPHHDWLKAQWDAGRPVYQAEVELALTPDAGATALGAVAEALAKPVMLESLPGDLAALADSIRTEGADAPADSAAWLELYKGAMVEMGGKLDAARLWQLRDDMSLVGKQKITDDLGSDTFARTVSHASVIAVSSFASPAAQFGRFKVVQTVLGSLRGYLAMVWAMVSYLTRGSVIGARVVSLTVAAGAVLLTVAVFVPGVPTALTAAGVLLLLAGASASALLTRHAFWMGVRIVIAALVVLAAVSYPVAHRIAKHDYAGITAIALKVLVGLMIVLLGWFVSYTGRAATLSGRSVRWRVVLLALGVTWWAVVSIVVNGGGNSHAGVWRHASTLALVAAVAALVQVVHYSGALGKHWTAHWLVILTQTGLLGAAASAILDLTGKRVDVLSAALRWSLPVALAGAVGVVLWTGLASRWQDLARKPAVLVGIGLGVAAVTTVPVTAMSSGHPPTWAAVVIVGCVLPLAAVLAARPRLADIPGVLV